MPGDGTVDLAEQLRAHLESLRAAGVLLLPRPQKALVIRRAAPAPAAVVAPPPEDPLQVRRHELDVLRAEVAACDKCSGLFATRLQTVFGSGALDAEVLFVGAAPGPDEEAQGEPFAGKGAVVLGRMINACGLTHDRVYLLNLIKCKTPKRRAPTNAECLNCRDFFRRQFELVRPKLVVALGEFAARALTGKKATLAELRGTAHQYRGVPLICTHHPDDIAKDEQDAAGRLKQEAGQDLRLIVSALRSGAA